MKLLTTLLLFMGLTFSAFAQDKDAYKAHNEGWITNLEEAYELSQKTDRPILANFTGSDWCGWCKRLTASVFSKPEFQKWAKENVILLELDFPRRTRLPQDLAKQNNELRAAFKVTGYPTIWVFDLAKDDEGRFQINALGKTGYTKTAAEFIENVKKMIARRAS